MDAETVSIKLTVLFEDPFWVGIFERTFEDMYEAARVVYGQEPRDYEVYESLKRFYEIKFSKPISGDRVQSRDVNPKRIQREIQKEIGKKGMSTKAHEAMKLQLEANKQERKKASKTAHDEDEKKKFEQKQQKKKDKKKGH